MDRSRTGDIDATLFAATAAFLGACLVLGGGQGGMGDLLLQLGALVLIALAASRIIHGGTTVESLRLPLLLVAAVVAIPLFHALPASGFAKPGPERALWGLLPAIGLFLAACVLAPMRRRQLLGVVLAATVIGLLLGLAQVADGPASPLRFYANTNPSHAVGFFANRNHLASLFVMALPLSVAAARQCVLHRSEGRRAMLPLVASVALTVLIVLGIALTRSRAGLALGLLGLLLSLPTASALNGRAGLKSWSGAGLGLAFLLSLVVVLFGNPNRVQSSLLTDLRWDIAAQTVDAARGNMPMGAGIGSFRSEFQASGSLPPTNVIINHAHNDFLELWLEGGWLFAVLAAMSLLLLLRAGARVLQPASGHTTALWPRAAWISILLVLIHSAFDYPLRTTSLQAVFAVLLAVLVSGPATSKTRAEHA